MITKRQRAFLLRQFFLLLKTRTKNIIASSRRSRTVDGGEVISEVEDQIQCIYIKSCKIIGSIKID